MIMNEDESKELEEVGNEEQKKEMLDIISFFDGAEPEQGKEEIKPDDLRLKGEETSTVVVVKEEEKIEVPPEKKEEVPPVVVVVDEKDSVIESLRAEINRLAALSATGGKEVLYPQKQEEVKVEEKKEEEKPPRPINDIFKKLYDNKNFLTKEQLDTVVDSPELINEAIYTSRVELMDSLLEALPLLVNTVVTREIVMNKAVTAFYDANKDLIPHSHYVQSVFKEVEQGNRSKTFYEISDLTAKECRKRLGLKELSSNEGEKVQVKQEVKPAFAGGKAGTTAPIDKSGKKEVFDSNAADILDMIDRM